MNILPSNLDADQEVGIKEAKDSLSQLIAAVRNGETVYLMNRGERVAKLVPVNPPPASAHAKGKGIFKNKIHLPAAWATQKAREHAESEVLKTIEGL